MYSVTMAGADGCTDPAPDTLLDSCRPLLLALLLAVGCCEPAAPHTAAAVSCSEKSAPHWAKSLLLLLLTSAASPSVSAGGKITPKQVTRLGWCRDASVAASFRSSAAAWSDARPELQCDVVSAEGDRHLTATCNTMQACKGGGEGNNGRHWAASSQAYQACSTFLALTSQELLPAAQQGQS